MSKYKIILCDLDGTLLNDNGEINDIDKAAVNMAVKNGIEFIICTGRSFMSAERFYKELEILREENIGIFYNGSLIYDIVSKRIFYEKRIKIHDTFDIIKKCGNFKADIIVYIGDKPVVEKVTYLIDMYMKRSLISPIVCKDFNNYIDCDVSKVLLKGDNSELKKAMDYFKKDGRNVFFSSDTLLEFNPVNITKGSAVREIAKIKNIDIKNIIAIGDTFNDLDMIKTAGLGAVPLNASYEVKNNADYICENDNNNGAVAEVIKKFVL